MNDKPTKEQATDVLIVGAGPAGLMMACQLASHGINFRIIDKRDRLTPYSGALLIQARTLELWDELGLAEKALQRGRIARAVSLVSQGKQILSQDIASMGNKLSKFPFIFMLKQYDTEDILRHFIEDKGFRVERHTALINLYVKEQGVTASLRQSNTREEQLHCKYIVAADGYESTVRNLLHIAWEGEQSRYPLFVTDCSLRKSQDNTDAQPLFNIHKAQEDIIFAISKKSIAGFFKLDEGQWRVDSVITQRNVQAEPSFADATKDFAQDLAVNAKLEAPKWFSAFKTNTFLAGTFAKDRCFLIGDAAHVHTPIGAQGMNTGMQDAHNLAWKIAFVLKHACGNNLLDTYSLERRANALKLIQSTDRFFGYAIHQDWFTRRMRTQLVPWVLRCLGPFIKTAAFQRSFFKSISQVNVNYKLESNAKRPSLFTTNRPNAGEKWPFIPSTVNASANLRAKLSVFNYTLLVFIKNEGKDRELLSDIVQKMSAFNPIVKVESIVYSDKTRQLFEHLSIRQSCYFLVRPDEYIATRDLPQNIHMAVSYLQRMEK